MRAKKLPSGSWRCKVYIGIEDGKKRYRSVTVDDPTTAGKRECEALASEIALNRKRYEKGRITVKEAVDSHLSASALAPSTLSAYKAYQKNHFSDIENMDIQHLDRKDIQRWVDDLAKDAKPKTVRNIYGLLSASLARYDVSISARLPERVEPELYTPTDSDIEKLLRAIEGTEIEKAVLLGAFGTLRRGEIAPLTYGDINGDYVTVNKALSWQSDGCEWVLKAPKKNASIRTVRLPHEAIERILRDSGKPDERIVSMSPQQITNTFKRALKNVGIPDFRFHDLRVYAISIRHAIGIPDQYIIKDSGHSTDYVMKRIYRKAMDDKRREFSEKTSEYLGGILQKSAVDSTKDATKSEECSISAVHEAS